MSGMFRATTVVGRKVEKAGQSEQQTEENPVQQCANKNWIDIRYKYPSDRPVAGAEYVITDANGNPIASGKLDNRGEAHVTGLPDACSTVNITYTGDPKPFEIFNDRKPIANPYYQVAMQPAEKPNVFVDAAIRVMTPALELAAAYQSMQAVAGQWTWEAIQGDWNEDQTLGQIVFDSALSLIPVVDQAADVRDCCANLYQLTVKRRYDEFGPWFGLVMTVIGMIPELGTAIKGAVKCIIKVGKEAAGAAIKKGRKLAENLIEKSGIDLGQLIRFMNYFGEGNVVHWLREMLDKFGDFKKFIVHTINEILLKFKKKLLSLRNAVVDKITSLLSDICNSIDEVMSRVDDFVPQIMDRIKKWWDEATRNPEDYSIKGSTQTQNGAKQVADVPPAEAARKAWIKTAAGEAGMEEKELLGLIENSRKNGRRTIVRFTNPEALKWHGKDGFLPKSVAVKLKTEKVGPNAGLVVRPKGDYDQWEEWERQNVRYLIDNGYEFDGAGRLVDPKGNKFYGDYDLQGVQRQAKDQDGKDIFVEETSEPGVIDDINKDMGMKGRFEGQEKPIQHGAENDFWVKTDKDGKIIEDPHHGKTQMAGEEQVVSGNGAKMGRQYGDDERYLVVNPDGSVEMLDNPHELYQMYKKSGIPWDYDSIPATGEELAKAQAARKAKKEAYEKMAKAEVEAEKTQMQSLIDEIIGDGSPFSSKAPTDNGPLPFFKDDSVNDPFLGSSSPVQPKADPGLLPF